MNIPELLAPAGSTEALDAAIGEGADAVYLGLKSFNARMRSANFAYSQFEAAVRSLHRMGRKIYVTVNTVFEQREADRMYQLLKYLASVGPDGLIVQDFGVVRMVRDNFPSLKLHASTQMNIASAQGVNLLSKHGVSRVVLARELALGEIRELRERTNSELEVFVHGALCVSASGLCLFSSYLGGKSANRGMCTQACRRLYRQGGTDLLASEEGGYYFSPADFQLIDRIPELADAGVNSFKIEGRMKSAEYVGAVVAAYRRVIDGLDGNREQSIRDGLAILRNDFARKKTRFYFDWDPASDAPLDWLKADQDGGTGIPLGTILRVRGADDERRGLIVPGTVLPRPGDSVRLHRADDSERRAHKLTAAEPDPSGLWISIPEGFTPGDSVYLIQTRGMSKRYSPVINRNLFRGDLGAFRRSPGHDKAPEITLPPLKKKDAPPFPEGIYVAVSRIEDLYVLQSVRPIRVMLHWTRKTAAYILGADKAPDRPPLPFSPGETILVLDPYFPQAMEPILADEIAQLRALGCYQFVVNNPGHFALFRDLDGKVAGGSAASTNGREATAGRGLKPPALIAGPYLYTFNRWAAAFVASLGADAIITPLENNRQNLERTISAGSPGNPSRRGYTFVTLFAYPALFRIRAGLGGVYPFRQFQDSRGEQFRLISETDGSQVIPEKPFSIVDKRPFLEEAGFRRFILDLSGPPLKKKDYRTLMTALKAAAPLPDISRFNWKDGFYSPEPSDLRSADLRAK
ncbi:peptidase U32 [Spirochaetia bacterium]|nr:peptidase U32 [Spirochaetia bacterium]